jgi:hypothetical protein
MLPHEDVENAFRFLLGREPESEEVIAWFSKACSSREELRALVMGSEEFGRGRGALSVATLDPTPVAIGPSLAQALALARRFTPQVAIGQAKCRVGGAQDGGYVMLDALAGTRQALSLGIGPDVSWDLQLAGGGAQVFQYDFSVEGPPEPHPNFQFHRQRVAATAGEGVITLGQAIAALPAAPPAERVLKIDIEHDEWAVLDAADPAVLGGFAQIVCEFHWFNNAADPAWLARAERVLDKLGAQFQVVHVHGNNCAPCLLLAGIPFPAVLEVSFASRARFRFGPSEEVFPTPLDRPNHPGLHDHWLGRFDFSAGPSRDG